MSEARPLSSRDLGMHRTVMAADRTLMAWTRTSLSLISFGFTIFKFLQYARQEGLTARTISESGPRHLGMVMISMGVVFLSLASVQFWTELRRLQPLRKSSVWRLPLFAALILTLVGVLALANAAFNVGPF